jgi:hypothetical protein
MKFGVRFDNEQLGREYKLLMDRHSERHRAALLGAAEEARNITLREARHNIANAGRFGPRWTQGLTGEITREGDDRLVTQYQHAIPYWSVFQFGKVIRGRPLLWIPLSFARDAQGVRARDFPQPLFRVDRKGGKAPLLLSAEDKQPKYFGRASVTIPKKFRVLEIIKLVSSRIQLFFEERLRR